MTNGNIVNVQIYKGHEIITKLFLINKDHVYCCYVVVDGHQRIRYNRSFRMAMNSLKKHIDKEIDMKKRINTKPSSLESSKENDVQYTLAHLNTGDLVGQITIDHDPLKNVVFQNNGRMDRTLVNDRIKMFIENNDMSTRLFNTEINYIRELNEFSQNLNIILGLPSYEHIFRSQVFEAIGIAEKVHIDQKDKGGNLYINHPLRVSVNTKSQLGKIIAILHDAIEDAETPMKVIKDIDEKMGYMYTAMVLMVTRFEDESYTDYINRICENPFAIEVKIQDMKDNMDLSRLNREPTEKDLERQDKYGRMIDILEDEARKYAVPTRTN